MENKDIFRVAAIAIVISVLLSGIIMKFELRDIKKVLVSHQMALIDHVKAIKSLLPKQEDQNGIRK